MAATLTALTAALNRAWGFVYGNAASPRLARGNGNPTINLTTDWTYGTGNAQADELYEKTHTLSGTTPLSLDFSGGALINPQGAAVSLAKVGLYFIKNTSASSDIAITGNLATALGINSGFVLKPGASLSGEFRTTKPTVTNSSADTLTFTPTVGGSLYVLVLGVSA